MRWGKAILAAAAVLVVLVIGGAAVLAARDDDGPGEELVLAPGLTVEESDEPAGEEVGASQGGGPAGGSEPGTSGGSEPGTSGGSEPGTSGGSEPGTSGGSEQGTSGGDQADGSGQGGDGHGAGAAPNSGGAPRTTRFPRERRKDPSKAGRRFAVPPAHVFTGRGNALIGTVDVQRPAVVRWRARGSFGLEFGREAFPIIAPSRRGELVIPPFRFDFVRVLARGRWRIFVTPQG